MSGKSSTTTLRAIAGAGAYGSLAALAAMQAQALTPLDVLLTQLRDIKNYFMKTDLFHDNTHRVKRLSHFIRLMDAANRDDFLTIQAAAPRILLLGEYYNLVQELEYETLAQHKNHSLVSAAIDFLRKEERNLTEMINLKSAHHNAKGADRVKLDVATIITNVNNYFNRRFVDMEAEWRSKGRIDILTSTKDLQNIGARLSHWSQLLSVSDYFLFRKWDEETPVGLLSVHYATVIVPLKAPEWLSVYQDEEIGGILKISVRDIESQLERYKAILERAREQVPNRNNRFSGSGFLFNSVNDFAPYPLKEDLALQDLSVSAEQPISRSRSLSK